MSDPKIHIHITTQYLAQHSNESQHQYAFSYTITISNAGDETVQLMSRFWHICDANGDKSEVSGQGVVGQQPLIKPNEQFTYTSGCVLKSPVGTMHGHYQMQLTTGELINVAIPIFRLAKPHILN